MYVHQFHLSNQKMLSKTTKKVRVAERKKFPPFGNLSCSLFFVFGKYCAWCGQVLLFSVYVYMPVYVCVFARRGRRRKNVLNGSPQPAKTTRGHTGDDQPVAVPPQPIDAAFCCDSMGNVQFFMRLLRGCVAFWFLQLGGCLGGVLGACINFHLVVSFLAAHTLALSRIRTRTRTLRTHTCTHLHTHTHTHSPTHRQGGQSERNFLRFVFFSALHFTTAQFPAPAYTHNTCTHELSRAEQSSAARRPPSCPPVCLLAFQFLIYLIILNLDV